MPAIRRQTILLIIFLACFAAFQLIQRNWRRNYSGNSEIIQYLLGVAPNFLAAIGLCCLFTALLPKRKILNLSTSFFAPALSFVLLMLWEVQQRFSGLGLRFDVHDLIWTLVGCGLFLLLNRLFLTKHNTGG